jgi:hypothetical protein
MLEFANTYYLAFRDLRRILATHVTGARVLDFGYRTGRSTRFRRDLRFNVTGIDISDLRAVAMPRALLLPIIKIAGLSRISSAETGSTGRSTGKRAFKPSTCVSLSPRATSLIPG